MKNTITYSFLILTFGVMLIGCMSEKQAASKIAKVEAKQPKVIAKYCSTRFPPLVYDSTRTEYLQGEPVVFIDTLTEVVRDTVYKTILKTIYKTDTVETTRTKQVEDKAGIEAVRLENEDLKKLLDGKDAELNEKDKRIASITESRNDWRRYCWITWVIMAILLAIKLFGGYVKGLIRPV